VASASSRTRQAGVLLCLCLALGTIGRTAAADDWTLVGNEHGIEIYRRDVPGSSVVALKGKGIIDAPLWKVASVLLDTKRAPEWGDSLKESRVVRRLSLNSYVEYNHIGLPLILKDRDFLSEVRIDVDAIQRRFALVYRLTDDPQAPNTHNVRGQITSGAFDAQSLDGGQRTELTAEIHCDPRGAIPAWVVNLFQKSWPRNTFERLRKQVVKSDIAMPAEFKDVLAPTLEF